MTETRALLIDVQQESSKTKEIVATLGWVEKLPVDRGGHREYGDRLDWSELDIPKSKFALLKAIKIKHPDVPEPSDIQLHPDGEFDIEITLTLEEEEEILGFQFNEVKNLETGASELYHPQVLLRNGEASWLEPLSRHWFHPAPKYPGKVQWLPPTAGPPGFEGSEVINLRAMQGTEHSHIVGVIYSSTWSVKSWTGQTLLFWIDMLGLVFGMFYADIALDIKQLVLFYNKGLFDYCAFNGLGLLIPPIVTMREALKWQHRPSPEKEFVKRLINTDFLQKMIIVAAIVSQTHMLLLVMLSVHFRKKHPLLEASKNAEVAESAISALVQTSFIISVVVGVESVAALDLSNADLQSMATSIAVSCCSAGLSFAARDKSDSAVLALPGKITWGPTMGCLVLVRSMEVASRMICFNVIQVSIRGPWFLGHVSGPIAVVLYAAAAALCFREAELADILASVVAHPGQILEPHSLVPLRHSLMFHFLLVLAAGVPQVLLRMEYRLWMPADAKEFPTEYVVGWLLITICSFMGLFLLSFYGSCLEHPSFETVCEEDGSIFLSSFVAAFKSKDSQVPKAVVASLGNHYVSVDTGNLTLDTFQELIETECPLGFKPATFNHLIRLFSVDFGDEAAPAEVMGCLRCCNLVSLDLSGCFHIQAAAWQQLRGATWRNLKNAHFAECFNDHSKWVEGAADLLRTLSQSHLLEEVDLAGCFQIPAAAWQQLRGATWRNLKKANFSRCFNYRSQGVEGAADLLEALSRSPQLEELNFYDCSQIPAAAWQKLLRATWRNLKKAHFHACFNYYYGDQGVEGAADLLETLSQSPQLEELNFYDCSQIPAAAWQQLLRATWRNLKKANFSRCFDHRGEGVEGAADVLEALSQSPLLEELNFFDCSQIPAAAWQKLRRATWRNLKTANFNSCFDDRSKGVEGAADLLQALSQSPQLEELDLADCSQIPAAPWQQIPSGAWPKLRRSLGIPEEEVTRLCPKAGGLPEDGAMQAEPSGIAEDNRVCLAVPRRLKTVVAQFLDSHQDAVELMAVLSLSHHLEEVNGRYCHKIPAAAWQQLRGATWRNLKKADFKSCFDHGSKGVEGAADLLEALSQSPQLEELNFFHCSQIPAAAWQQLRGATWRNLKTANFNSCFFDYRSKGVEGAADLLEALSQSPQLEELGLAGCAQIPAAAWQQLRGATWRNLKTANFNSCFDYRSKGVEGAADLLEALSQSPQLEELDLAGCAQIPAAAWQQIPSGAWPKLRSSPNIPDWEVPRLRGVALD